ncbi:MAG: hypothetical protein RIR45_576 [Pseudomonadota bacterium]|jgi:hypothetical protein
MNRCIRTHTRISLMAALLCLGSAAMAQPTVRPFPPAAERGAMQITAAPDMVLNGAPARLSPGARIRGVDNMLVMSASLTGQKLLVNFVREPLGLVHEVWILNADEAKLELPKRIKP